MARQKNPDRIDRREWVTRSFTETALSVKVWNKETDEMETVFITLPVPFKECSEKRVLNALYDKYAESRKFLKLEENYTETTRIKGVKISKFLEDAEDLTDKL